MQHHSRDGQSFSSVTRKACGLLSHDTTHWTASTQRKRATCSSGGWKSKSEAEWTSGHSLHLWHPHPPASQLLVPSAQGAGFQCVNRGWDTAGDAELQERSLSKGLGSSAVAGLTLHPCGVSLLLPQAQAPGSPGLGGKPGEPRSGRCGHMRVAPSDAQKWLSVKLRCRGPREGDSLAQAGI